jgi:hypothetical protein
MPVIVVSVVELSKIGWFSFPGRLGFPFGASLTFIWISLSAEPIEESW